MTCDGVLLAAEGVAASAATATKTLTIACIVSVLDLEYFAQAAAYSLRVSDGKTSAICIHTQTLQNRQGRKIRAPQ
jgi:ABC-type sugar transport system substrate-binding protein